MIQIGGQGYALDDPGVLVVIGGALAILAILILLIVALRGLSKTARMTEPMFQHMTYLGQSVQNLANGQQQLAGGLQAVTEAQAASQAQMLTSVEKRLEEVTARMGESLQGSATRTARSLGELQQRLETIMADPALFLANMRTAFNLAPHSRVKDGVVRLPSRRMGNNFNNTVNDRPQTPVSVPDSDIDYLRNTVHQPLESLLGYDY